MIKNAPYTRLYRTFDRFCNSLEGRYQAELRPWVSKDLVKQVCKKLNLVQEVITLWSSSRPIRISNFYYPPKIRKISSDNPDEVNFAEEKNASYYEDFDVEAAVLIEGTVGHGKSVHIRQLHHNELNAGDTLPIFIELRKIKHPKCLREHVCEIFETRLGLNCSIDLLDELIEKGFVSFFFDGFDEVAHKYRADLVAQLEDIYLSSNAKLKMIVTSRPETILRSSSIFSVCKMVDLDEHDQEQLIRKILREEEYTPLLKNLNGMDSKFRELLSTPLIVTLFAHVYKTKLVIPDSYVTFYKLLFDSLASGHDGIKLGFTRPSKSKLSSTQMQTVIEYLALLTKCNEEKIYEFDEDWLIEKCISALDMANVHNTSPYAFLDDLVDNTCLMQKHGDKYRFLHDTIQFYFVASCVKNNANDEEKADFYGARLTDDWKEWEYVLDFLYAIDEANFCKMFYIPSIKQLFAGPYFPNDLNFSKYAIDGILELSNIILVDFKGEIRYGYLMVAYHCWAAAKLISNKDTEKEKVNIADPISSVMREELAKSKNMREMRKLLASKRPSNKDKQFSLYIVKFSEVVRLLRCRNSIAEALDATNCTQISNKYKKLQKVIEKRKKISGVWGHKNEGKLEVS